MPKAFEVPYQVQELLQIPSMSFSIAEDELRTMGPETMAGDYATWDYFQSIEGEGNGLLHPIPESDSATQ